MKKLLQLAILMALGLGVACEGPEGPEGPQGEPGAQGPAGAPGVPGPAGEDAQSAQIFDIPDVTFNAENGYGIGLSFAENDIEVLESDVVVVYLLWTVTEGGEPFFAPLPQSFNHESGEVKYSYFFSPQSLIINLTPSFDPEETPIGQEWTDQNYFRVVVLPGGFLEEENARTLGGRQPGELSSLSYKELIKTIEVSDEEVPLIQLQ